MNPPPFRKLTGPVQRLGGLGLELLDVLEGGLEMVQGELKTNPVYVRVFLGELGRIFKAVEMGNVCNGFLALKGRLERLEMRIQLLIGEFQTGLLKYGHINLGEEK